MPMPAPPSAPTPRKLGDRRRALLDRYDHIVEQTARRGAIECAPAISAVTDSGIAFEGSGRARPEGVSR